MYGFTFIVWHLIKCVKFLCSLSPVLHKRCCYWKQDSHSKACCRGRTSWSQNTQGNGILINESSVRPKLLQTCAYWEKCCNNILSLRNSLIFRWVCIKRGAYCYVTRFINQNAIPLCILWPGGSTSTARFRVWILFPVAASFV
jgi:hypothetical protein